MVILEEQSEIESEKDYDDAPTVSQDVHQAVLAVPESDVMENDAISDLENSKTNDSLTSEKQTSSQVSVLKCGELQSLSPIVDQLLDNETCDVNDPSCNESNGQKSVCLDIHSLSYLDSDESDNETSTLPVSNSSHDLRLFLKWSLDQKVVMKCFEF